MGNRVTMTSSAAWALMRQVREVRLAAVVDGQPLLRTMHPAVVGERLIFHGAPKGEKASWMGCTAVAAAEEVVARIPSWMRHPEKACPATTYYRSAQIEGTLMPVEDSTERAAALQALMTHLQPEGGYRPLTAADPLYTKTIAGLGLWALEPRSISGVSKLGQHLRGDEMQRILAGLWKRGEPGDLLAIEQLSAAHPEQPMFRQVGPGLRPRCHPNEDDVRACVELLRGTYWNLDFPYDVLADGVRGTTAWVGLEAEAPGGGRRLVATARAIGDGRKRGWIYDVVVAPDRRGQGLGTQLMELLLDHPRVRDTEVLQLGTRDAVNLYAQFGFAEQLTRGEGAHRRTLMVRSRSSTQATDERSRIRGVDR